MKTTKNIWMSRKKNIETNKYSSIENSLNKITIPST
jgi:hypothetical protein